MPQLSLTNIHRTFRAAGQPDAEVLRGISLTISEGDFVAIVGPSGGGKSTLLNIIGLLDVPSAGRYRVGDIDIGSMHEHALCELRSDGFAFIFQNFHLLERRPVTDSVELALLYRGVPKRDRRARALDALASVGLAASAEQMAGALSGGERQRVAIARALASEAPVVVADEPTGNLDSRNSAAVVEGLTELNRAGRTVILVTHSSEVASSADRILQLNDGIIESTTTIAPTSIGSLLGDAPGAPGATPPTPADGSDDQMSAPGRASTVRPRDLLADAVATLCSRFARTLALTAAVALAVGLAIATTGLSASSAAQISMTFDLHANHDVTARWNAHDVELSAADVGRLPRRLAALSGVERAGLLFSHDRHLVQATPARAAIEVPVYTVTSDTLRAARGRVRWADGSTKWPKRAERGGMLAPGEVVVGAGLAGQLPLGPLVGAPAVALDGRDVTVVGVLDSSPRFPELSGAVIGTSADRANFGPLGDVTGVVLTGAGAARQVASQVALVIHPESPDAVAVSAPSDPTTLRHDVEAEVSTTLFAVTAIASLAAVAALANAMVMSVLERRQEFGLRRALGARPRHIFALVMAESSLVGVFGGLVGLAGGLGAVLAVTIIRQWSPVFDPALAPLAVIGGVVVGSIGGVIASIRAARIAPTAALRA